MNVYAVSQLELRSLRRLGGEVDPGYSRVDLDGDFWHSRVLAPTGYASDGSQEVPRRSLAMLRSGCSEGAGLMMMMKAFAVS